jgi:putative aldouronate transport system substrate-binding protein
MKKRFIPALAAACLLALVSCRRPQPETTASPGIGDLDPLGKYNPPITLSWGVNSSAVQQFKGGDTYENNIWTRRYKDDLGIIISIDFTADGSSGAYNNRLNLALASGDLPDIVSEVPYQLFRQAVDGGLVTDITEIYDQYAGERMKAIKQRYPAAFDYASVNGRLYGMAGLNDNRQFATVLWIRDDWLKNLGLDAPTTIDELVEVARAFTFKDPDGNGLNDTYGLGLQNGLVSANFGHITGILSAFGVPAYEHSLYYREENGKINFSYLNPGTKDALRLVQRMYREGLVDPEFNVKDTNKYADDIASGKVGMHFGLQWGTWWPWNGLWTASKVTAHPYPVPTVPGITPKTAYQNNQSGNLTILNSRVKNPEAFIKMFNLYINLINTDTSDEDFSTYFADEQHRFSPTKVTEPQEPNYGPLYWEAFRAGSPSSLPNTLKHRYNQILGFANGTDTSTDAYGVWGQYSLEGSMYVIMNEYAPKGWMVEGILGARVPETYITNSSTLQTITEQAFTEIIMGADINQYENYTQNWLRAGGQQILNEMEVLYPAR